MNVITSAQIGLIGLGVVLQFVARVAWRREWVGVPKEKRPVEERAKTRPVAQAPRRNSALVRPSARERDFYEMEKTPPGIPPGELAKTAKVRYVDGG